MNINSRLIYRISDGKPLRVSLSEVKAYIDSGKYKQTKGTNVAVSVAVAKAEASMKKEAETNKKKEAETNKK